MLSHRLSVCKSVTGVSVLSTSLPFNIIEYNVHVVINGFFQALYVH